MFPPHLDLLWMFHHQRDPQNRVLDHAENTLGCRCIYLASL